MSEMRGMLVCCLLVVVNGAGNDVISRITTATFPGIETPHAMASDADGFLYLSAYGFAHQRLEAHAIKVRELDLHVSEQEALGPAAHFVEQARTDSRHVYFTTNTDPGIMLRRHKRQLTADGNITFPSQTVLALELDEFDMYFMTFTAPAQVIKYSKEGYSQSLSETLSYKGVDLRWIVSSTSDQYFLYGVTSDRPVKVAKIKKSDLKIQGIFSLQADMNLVHTILQEERGEEKFLYVGTQESPAHVLKITKGNMKQEGATLVLSYANHENWISAMAQNDQHLFVLLNPSTGPASVVKVLKNGLIRVSTFAFNTEEVHPAAAAVDSSGLFLYVMFSTNPGRITKLSTQLDINCVPSYWGPWSPCSKSCGGGTKTQNRTVVVQQAGNGFDCVQQCSSSSVQQRCLYNQSTCNEHECPVHCEVGSWGPPGPCNPATGQRTSRRKVIVQPMHNGRACPKTESHTPCLVDCYVSAYSEWSECDKRRGWRIKTRSVTTVPKNGGKACPPLVKTSMCNVDCEVTEWSAWSGCELSTGVRQRSRKVQVMNKHFGAACPVLSDFEDCTVHCLAGAWGPYSPCQIQGEHAGTAVRTRSIIQEASNGGRPCTLEQYAKCAVSCEVTAWTPYSDCDKMSGTKFRNRTVASYSQNGGDACPLLDDVTDCPVDCEVSPWSAWATCDNFGEQRRERLILVEQKNGGAPCPEIKAARNCTVDCYVSDWTDWDECSATCDGGTHSRYRVVEVQNQKGGTPCPALTESKECNMHSCAPTDCEVSDWAAWTPCSSPCGTGIRTRQRSIIVEPGYDGEPCGALADSSYCNTQLCVIDCSVGDWQPWEDVPCVADSGTQTRNRAILEHPQAGGASCPPLTATRPCDVNCKVSDWGDWGECVGGMQKRQRAVTMSQKNGGIACPDLQQFQDCGSAGCPVTKWPDKFSACSNDGFRVRERQLTETQGWIISNGVATHEAQNLVCALRQQIDCVVNCQVGPWPEWKDVECEPTTGLKTRERQVLVLPKNSGTACPNLSEQDDCVVDCKVSQWSHAWDQVECNRRTGTKTRDRTIIHHPLNDGMACPHLSDTETCAVDCFLADWGEWSACNMTAGVETRRRDILWPPLNGGQTCDVLEERRDCAELCNEDAQKQLTQWGSFSSCDRTTGMMTRTRNSTDPDTKCRREDIAPCPVSCEFSDWGSWGACDQVNDVKIRHRTIVVQPLNGGVQCPPMQEQDTCVVNCVFTPLTQWSACDKSTGKENRTRTVLVSPLNGGTDCPPTLIERSCTVDCLLDDWGDFGNCDKSTGVELRERRVIYASRNGGEPCGPLTEPRDCDVHCDTSDWGSYSQCESATGTQTRSRSITVVRLNEGNECPELHDVAQCAVNCDMTTWTDWSTCDFSVSAKGTQTRLRNVKTQPMNGGAGCGDTSESRGCQLPTPAPTPKQSLPPTPAPDPEEQAIKTSTFDYEVRIDLRINGLNQGDFADGSDARKALVEVMQERLGLVDQNVRFELMEHQGTHETYIRFVLEVSRPGGNNDASLSEVELKHKQEEDDRLNAETAQQVKDTLALGVTVQHLNDAYRTKLAQSTGDYENRVSQTPIALLGSAEVKAIISATSEQTNINAPDRVSDSNGEKYTHRMTANFLVNGYTVRMFDSGVRRIFMYQLSRALSLGAPEKVNARSIAIVGFQTQQGGLLVHWLVRATSAKSADVAYHFQMLATDPHIFAKYISLAMHEKGRAFPFWPVELSNQAGGIETEKIVSGRGAQQGAGGDTEAQLENVEAAADDIQTTSMAQTLLLAASGFAAFSVIILILAFFVRRHNAKKEKNAFFDSMEQEYEGENLLDDGDWAALGDWGGGGGDGMFDGINPMLFEGGGGGFDAHSETAQEGTGSDKAANEL